MDRARAQAAELLKIDPKYCTGRGLHKDPVVSERNRKAMHKAGIPDCPPRRRYKQGEVKVMKAHLQHLVAPS